MYMEPWESYWQPVERLNSEQKKCLDELHEVWQEYIRGDFSVQLRRQYCLSYFRLLESVIADEVAKRSDHSRFLRRIVGFENLAIYPNSISEFSTTAATSTLRNPSYLLAKLRQPAAIDDCRFLPLITATDYKPIRLFYHYRRYCLAPHSGHSLLVFLPVCQKLRLQAFQTLAKFSYLISSDTDPRTSQRALRLVKRILVPYLKTVGFNEKPSEDVKRRSKWATDGRLKTGHLGRVCCLLSLSSFTAWCGIRRYGKWRTGSRWLTYRRY